MLPNPAPAGYVFLEPVCVTLCRRGVFTDIIKDIRDFLGGPVAKISPADARDTGSIPGLGRFHMPRGN